MARLDIVRTARSADLLRILRVNFGKIRAAAKNHPAHASVLLNCLPRFILSKSFLESWPLTPPQHHPDPGLFRGCRTHYGIPAGFWGTQSDSREI